MTEILFVQGNVHSFGQGAALFGSGFDGGILTIYVGPVAGSAVMSAGNSMIDQAFTKGWKKISWNQVLGAGFIGGVTSYAGGHLGKTISGAIGKITDNIASPILRDALTQSLTNSATGFTIGTGVAKRRDFGRCSVTRRPKCINGVWYWCHDGNCIGI